MRSVGVIVDFLPKKGKVGEMCFSPNEAAQPPLDGDQGRRSGQSISALVFFDVPHFFLGAPIAAPPCAHPHNSRLMGDLVIDLR